MGTKKITLYNDFHNTEVNLLVRDGKISRNQILRARRELCGIRDCVCGDEFGTRGPQDVLLEPIYFRHGVIGGAVVVSE